MLIWNKQIQRTKRINKNQLIILKLKQMKQKFKLISALIFAGIAMATNAIAQTSGYFGRGNGTTWINSTTPLFEDITNSRIGIGTTAPASLLNVSDASTTGGELMLTSTVGNNATSGIIFRTPYLGTNYDGSILSSFYGTTIGTTLYHGMIFTSPRDVTGINPAVGFVFNSHAGNTRMIIETSTGNVGIGTTTPGTKLEVNGAVKITDGNQAVRKVLTSDANGLASWSINGAISSGSNNTAIGYATMNYNTSGSANVALGDFALEVNTTGSANTACGVSALIANTSGGYNTAVGDALAYNTTGVDNTAVGYGALNQNTIGNYNTALGYQAAPTANNLSNSMELGYNAQVSVTNYIAIGNSSIQNIWAQVDLTIGSDKRIKDDVKENVPGLAFISKLRPVTYHYNIHRENEILGIKDGKNWDGKYDIEKTTMTGFIAKK